MSGGLGCADCDTMRLGLGYLRGLGQDDGTGAGDGSDDPIFTPAGPSDSQLFSGTSDCAFGGVYPACNPNPITSTSPLTTTTGTPVSSGNTALDTALANIAAQWTKIAGQTIAPQTTIVGPNGLQITTPAGQTSALSSLFSGSSLLSSSSSATLSALLPWLLIGGAGLLAMKAFGK
jgi:hypothetical protein